MTGQTTCRDCGTLILPDDQELARILGKADSAACECRHYVSEVTESGMFKYWKAIPKPPQPRG